MDAGLELTDIFILDRLLKGVRVPAAKRMAVSFGHPIEVIVNIQIRYKSREVTVLVHFFHHDGLFQAVAFHADRLGAGKESLYDHTVLCLVGAQYLFRSVVLRVDDRFDLRPLHILK